MLFTSSFKLLSVAAFMLPALLVGASPHSLSERRGNGEIRHVTFNECVPASTSSADCPDAIKITLIPREGEINIFDVQGGWKDEGPATAELTISLSDARKWAREDDALAYGHDNRELLVSQLTYYVIFKSDEKRDDSDGSDDTIKAV